MEETPVDEEVTECETHHSNELIGTDLVKLLHLNSSFLLDVLLDLFRCLVLKSHVRLFLED